MYDTAARVQEIIDLTPSMLRFDKPATIKFHGKGRKDRIVPMLDGQIRNLQLYLKENKLDEPSSNEFPLFHNYRGEKLTRAGVNFILKKYIRMARAKAETLIPERISCHSLRHSKAMHLFQAGVNIVYIRDFLGHTYISTTEIYARADSKQKREALEKAYPNINPNEEPTWKKDNDLKATLRKVGRNELSLTFEN